MVDGLTLLPGDKVFWEDPNGGICSGIYTLIEVIPNSQVCVITNFEGINVECFSYQLS